MSRTTRKWFAVTFIATSIAALCTIAIINAATSTVAKAAKAVPFCNECPPLGQTICCPGVSKSQLEALGYTLNVTANTDGCFVITACVPPPPCTPQWQVDLKLESFSGTANDPNLGTITWRNDPTKSSSLATLRSKEDAASEFPATGTISFYAEAEVEGIPGVFRSETEVKLYNDNVTSFNPFVNEVFVTHDADMPIKFINEESGDEITLTSLESTLN